MSVKEDQAAGNKPQLVESKLPKKLIAFTLLVVIGLSLAHWQVFYLSERFNLSPDTLNVITLCLPLLLFVMWVYWAFFVSKLRLVGLFILAIPTVFFTLFYPNIGGSANILGWTPRFWKNEVALKTVVPENITVVDLSSTTPVDFPQFLGVNRDAVVAGVDLANDWETSSPKFLWKQSIGEGWSGFAAVNGFAVTQEQRDSEECVSCYDIESGDLMWIRKTPRRHEDTMALGKVGPRATPTIDEGLVYVTSATGVLDCLDGSNGELVWSVDVPALVGISQVSNTNSRGLAYTYEASNLNWGRSCSPLIYQDKVIIPAGGPSEDTEKITTTLIAFDKKTGEEIWRGGNRMVAYGSPSVATVLGKPQILLVAESKAVGHDPETGAELWNHERPGFSNANANCSQVTFVSDSQLLLSKGYNLGGELIELSGVDGLIRLRSVQQDPRLLKTKLTNPVVFRGHAYSLSGGFLECVEIESFERKWKQRGLFGNGQILFVGDKLLVHSENGTLILVAADPSGYMDLGSMKTIDGICWNTMCLYGNRLLVRSEKEAACIELPTR
jgi:outer membrane protein assembly factor BamB